VTRPALSALSRASASAQGKAVVLQLGWKREAEVQTSKAA
jgi:hypothetical protein